MVKAPQQLETDRLTLHRPLAADAEAIFERYASDPAVTTYVGWPRHRSVFDTKAFIAFSDSEWERAPCGPYLITLRADGRLIGSTGLSFEAANRADTGYVLARDAWGLGYATEALNATIDLARKLGVARLRALCHPDHNASWRVLEKCGFSRDSVLPQFGEFPNLAPGVLADVACYFRTLDQEER